MANLFDFITNVGNNLKNKASNLYDKVTAPNLPAIQLDDSGAIDYQKSFDLALKQPRTPLEHAFGRTVSMDIDTIDPKTNEVATERIEKYQPGFFDHLTSGAKENFNTKFSPDNLSDNRTKYGQKGFGYRLGEGLGTLGRFMESPLGRGVLVGGLIGATGGDGLQALAYGAGTTTANQGYRMRDRAYRDDLIKNEQQSVMNSKGFKNLDSETQQNLLNDVANRVNGYRGYITDDLYGNMIKAQQLRDNAEYRNLYLDSQLRNQEEMAKYRQAQLAQQANQDRLDNYYKGQQIAQGWKRLEQNNKPSGNIGNLQAVSQQLQRFEDTFKTMPGKFESNTLGRLRSKTGFQTPAEANFDSQRTLLFNKIARDLGGEKGVLSDQDIKRIEKSLPAYTDSYEQKQAKMRAIYDLLEDRLSVEGGSLNRETDNDPMGIL